MRLLPLLVVPRREQTVRCADLSSKRQQMTRVSISGRCFSSRPAGLFAQVNRSTVGTDFTSRASNRPSSATSGHVAGNGIRLPLCLHNVGEDSPFAGIPPPTTCSTATRRSREQPVLEPVADSFRTGK